MDTVAGFEVTTGVELPLRVSLGEGEREMVLVGEADKHAELDWVRLIV